MYDNPSLLNWRRVVNIVLVMMLLALFAVCIWWNGRREYRRLEEKSNALLKEAKQNMDAILRESVQKGVIQGILAHYRCGVRIEDYLRKEGMMTGEIYELLGAWISLKRIGCDATDIYKELSPNGFQIYVLHSRKVSNNDEYILIYREHLLTLCGVFVRLDRFPDLDMLEEVEFCQLLLSHAEEEANARADMKAEKAMA